MLWYFYVYNKFTYIQLNQDDQNKTNLQVHIPKNPITQLMYKTTNFTGLLKVIRPFF